MEAMDSYHSSCFSLTLTEVTHSGTKTRVAMVTGRCGAGNSETESLNRHSSSLYNVEGHGGVEHVESILQYRSFS